ncbi:MAG: hypothetical protein E5Y16_00335 [Mesorhizobium sp.]|nr:MAG: hypothetical protein EOS08_04265 [Mesorhizobium sp.]TJV47201.1 MAG: hypothetical protein E5Y16_00335 [Mesorhizobium sp.]
MLNNILKIAGANAAGQAITIIVAPILTRLYAPDSFGAQAAFITYTSLFSAFATLSLNQAYVIEKWAYRVHGLVIATYVSIISVTLLLFILLLALPASFIVDVVGVNKTVALLLPLSVLFNSIALVQVGLALRDRGFALISLHYLTSSISISAFRLAGGMLLATTTTMIATYILGVIASIIPFLGRRLRPPSLISRICIIPRAVWGYRDFVFLRTPQTFINMFSVGFPILFINSNYGSDDAGFYSLAMSMLGVPAALFSQAVSSVIMASMTDFERMGHSLHPIITRYSSVIAALAFPPFLLIGLFSPMVFSIVFGPEWIDAGLFAQAIGASAYFMFINKPAVVALTVRRRQGILLSYEVLSVFIKLLLCIFSELYDLTAFQFVLALSLTSSFLYVFLIAFSMLDAKGSPN